jgi:hypothetical protein
MRRPAPTHTDLWRRFAIRLLATTAGGIGTIFLLLCAVDPWGALPFHGPLPRVFADHSQRWAYPALAREPRFDAAIFGDSTARLIDPAPLNAALSARFANLAMTKAQAFEQLRLMDVFIQAHARPRAILIGLDKVWCDRRPDIPHFGYDAIPDWLYDGDTVAAFRNLLSLHAIETAVRDVSTLLGRSPPPYGPDGYTLIWFDKRPYDAARARAIQAREEAIPWPDAPGDPESWHYPALEWLVQRLDALPSETRKLLVFVPTHDGYPPPGPGRAMMAECKRRVAGAALRWPNTLVIDLAIPSASTKNDDNWWDAMHIRAPVAERVTEQIASAAAGQDAGDALILVGSSAGQESAAR